MFAYCCYLLFLVPFVYAEPESVYEHRNKTLQLLMGNKIEYTTEDGSYTITLYPMSNITVAKNGFFHGEKVYETFRDEHYISNLFGSRSVYNESYIYGNYYHSELFSNDESIWGDKNLVQVNYGCCGMPSREHIIRLQHSAFEDVNFIYFYNSTQRQYGKYKTADVYVCSLFFCDHFTNESIAAYKPARNYRYNVSFQAFSNEQRQAEANRIRSLFLFGFQHYMDDAYPAPQLDPLTCGKARFPQCDIPYMTLIDSLDTLHVLELDDLFVESVKLLEDLEDFDYDVNVSVFETTIRVVGGLVSSHMILVDNPKIIEEFNKKHENATYEYKNHLLDLAVDIANRLLPAFQSNDLAYGSVNLHRGVLPTETPISSLAGIGSCLLEFAALTALTDDVKYIDAARRTLVKLFELRSPYDMVGKHIDILNEQWKEPYSCFGRNSDSFYEYLLKGYILLNDPQLYDMFMTFYYSFDVYSKSHTVHWYGVSDISNPDILTAHSYSLSAFWPGVQFLLGDYIGGKATLMRFLYSWDEFHYIPEYFSIMEEKIISGGEDYPLRPELIESMMYHDTVFGNGEMTHWAQMILSQLENTQTKCGFAGIRNILTGSLYAEMPSFMLSETLKYLYLLYNNGSMYRGRGFIFTTEAHVLNVSHIQRSATIQRYMKHMREKYNWDLRCNAGFWSDYSRLSRDMLSGDESLHGLKVPLQCPVVDDGLVLSSWFVYNDYVYYSYNHSRWDQLFTATSQTSFPIDSPSSAANPKHINILTRNNNNPVQVSLDSGSLQQFLSLLQQSQRPAETIDDRVKRAESRIALMRLLGMQGDSVLKSTEDEIEEDGTVFSFATVAGKRISISKRYGVRFEMQISSMSIAVDITSYNFLVYSEGTTDGTYSGLLVTNTLLENGPIQYECFVSLMLNDEELVLPAVVLHYAFPEEQGTESFIMTSGMLGDFNKSELLFVNEKNESQVIHVVPSFSSEGFMNSTTTEIFAVDAYDEVFEFIEESTVNPLIVNIRVEFVRQIKKYPLISRLDKHVLIETDYAAIGIVDGILDKNHLYIASKEGGDSIIASFMEYNKKREA